MRHLWRQRGYAGLNVLGLAVGLACCLLIALYVRYEWGFDGYHVQADQIYRLTLDLSATKHLAMVGPPVASDRKATYPDVVEAGRFVQGTILFQRADDPTIQYQESDG
jgi:putative ABC transport system permease protein